MFFPNVFIFMHPPFCFYFHLSHPPYIDITEKAFFPSKVPNPPSTAIQTSCKRILKMLSLIEKKPIKIQHGVYTIPRNGRKFTASLSIPGNIARGTSAPEKKFVRVSLALDTP